MKKLLILFWLTPFLSFSQSHNLVETSIDSLRNYIPVISSILGVSLHENVRPNNTYPIVFGDKESGTYIMTSFINKQITGGRELVHDISIHGDANKIDSLFSYFKTVGKARTTYLEAKEGVAWDNIVIYIFDVGKQSKFIQLRSRVSKKQY
jgi:UPF0288 family protein (methanogenesis marker protein 3)